MDNMRQKQGLFVSTLWVTLCCLLLSVSLSGCENLRKKFTRKKKKKIYEQEFIPVLDPLEYPDVITTKEDQYKHYYSLWRIWHKDFLTSLSDRDSDKRQKYLLSQILVQVGEMKSLLTGDKEQRLGQLILELKSVGEQYDVPLVMRKQSKMRITVNRIGQEVRNKFKITQVEVHLKP